MEYKFGTKYVFKLDTVIKYRN